MSNIRESITERLLGSLGSIILTILMAIGCVVFYYFALPPVNLRSGVFWVFLFIVTACIAASVTLLIGDESDTITAIAIILPIAIVVIGIVCEISSLMVFHADKAYQVADVTISEKPITEDFEDLTNPASLKNLPLVDLDTARMLGDKKVAKLQNASWYDVDDEYNLIKTKQGYYRLSVIDYGGFFKYNKAKNTGLQRPMAVSNSKSFVLMLFHSNREPAISPIIAPSIFKLLHRILLLLHGLSSFYYSVTNSIISPSLFAITRI